MTEEKKGKLVVIGIGLVMILVAILAVVLAVKTKHYPATVVEITDSKIRHSGKNSRKKYHEWVTVTFTDESGNERTATDVHIKESVESSLPKVGDTIQVKGKNRITEYRATSYIGTAIVLIFTGLVLLIRGLTYKPKPAAAENKEQTDIAENKDLTAPSKDEDLTAE